MMAELPKALGDAPSWCAADLEEASEMALKELHFRLHEYESALRFYARHEHWMALTEDPDSLHTHFAAMRGAGVQHGYHVAEHVLEKHGK